MFGQTSRISDAEQALQWTAQGHRVSGRPKNAWIRDSEKGMWTTGFKSSCGRRWRGQSWMERSGLSSAWSCLDDVTLGRVPKDQDQLLP